MAETDKPDEVKIEVVVYENDRQVMTRTTRFEPGTSYSVQLQHGSTVDAHLNRKAGEA